jgi:hypothetical protein
MPIVIVNEIGAYHVIFEKSYVELYTNIMTCEL